MTKKKLTRWRTDEVALLVENMNETPDVLTKLFPTRTYYSILSRRQKLVQMSLNANEETPQTSLKFEQKSEAIDDINEIMNQSLIKLEELTVKNSELVSENKELKKTIEKLTNKLNTVNDEFIKQKDKVEELASKSKNRWSLIKTVFFQ